MKIHQENGLEYSLEFDDVREFDGFFSELDKSGSFFVPLENIPEKAVFRARAAGSQRTRKLRIVRIVREASGYRVFIHMNKVENLPKSQPAVEKFSIQQEDEDSGKTVFERVHSLSNSEKVVLAMKANWMERRVLMQENNSKIHEFLLRNPRITEQEIAWLAQNPASPIQTILYIANNKQWMSSETIRCAVLTNPKSPAPLVLETIPRASEADLVKMHKTPHLRPDIKAAVLREMKKRGVRIRE